jgi:tetratricopeptide (TPR) repeat protein
MEHRLYLPSFGAASAFTTGFFLLTIKFSKPVFTKFLALSLVMILISLGIATFHRNFVWGNEIRLWKDVVEKSPHKARPLNNLGVALEHAGKREEAMKVLTHALDLDPDYFMTYYNLADLHLVSGQPEMSLSLLQTAIRLNPTFIEPYVSVGAALMRSGRFRDVIEFLEQNIDRVRGHAEAHFYLGASYAFLGDREAAMRELVIVSKLDPELAANLKGLMR